MLHLVGQTVDDCAEQGLVAEHDGCAPPVGNTVAFAQPFAGITCLDIFRRGRDKGDLFRSLETVEDFVVLSVKLVGEVAQILGDIVPSLLLHVVMVVVPVEGGLALATKMGEETLLHLLQKVEANKEIAVVFVVEAIVLGHLTVESALVGQPLLEEVCVVLLVDVAHV